jgi:hypothetical protein
MGLSILLGLAGLVGGLIWWGIPPALVLYRAGIVVVAIPVVWGIAAGVRSTMITYVSLLRGARSGYP